MDNQIFFPEVVKNIDTWLLFSKKDGDIYCIGDKSIDYYIKVNEYQLPYVLDVLQDLDGTHSEINIKKKFKNDIDIESLLCLLKNAGLIKNIPATTQKNEYERLSFILFECAIKKNYALFKNIAEFLVKKWTAIVGIIFIITTFIIFINSIIFFMTQPSTYQVFKSELANILCYLTISIVSIFIHELSHAAVATKFSLVPSTMTIALYLYTSLVVYLKIPGLYTLSPKKRIAVWGAGMFINSFIASIALWSYFFFNFSIFLLIATCNITLIIINLSPFLPLDGYFIMSTIFKEVNLRKKMLDLLKSKKLKKSNIFINLYLLISLILMFSLVSSQIIWLSKLIVVAYAKSSSLWEMLYHIRLIIIGFFLLLSITIVRKKIKRE